MTQTNGTSTTNGVHTNVTFNDLLPPLPNPKIGTLSLDLSNIYTRRHLSTFGTPHPNTPTTPSNGDGSSDSNTLSDREERAVAALLTRFKALVTLAAEPIQDGATREVAAAHGLQMEVEGSALVC